jgi:hypothetical protein
VPTVSHEKGESLGIVDGEGWLAAVIMENGVAIEQGTGSGEKLKYGWIEATQKTWWARGA